MSAMFLHTYYPQSILFTVGPVSIHWYGLFISLSLILCFLIAQKLCKVYKLSADKLYDLIFYLILFGIFGARVWHVLSEFNYYQQNPVDIFKIWQGGLAIHGALIAGILVIYFFKKINRLLLLDIFAPLVALGLALGRWGNYFNQELYGRPTDLPWGIPINLFNRLPDYQSFEFFQPIFLYESLWCLLLFGLLIYFHNLRFRKSPVQKSIVTLLHCYIVKNYGAIFFIFLILYSLERFLIGFLRVDPQASWFALRLDQWVSLLLIIIPVVLFIFLRKKQKIC